MKKFWFISLLVVIGSMLTKTALIQAATSCYYLDENVGCTICSSRNNCQCTDSNGQLLSGRYENSSCSDTASGACTEGTFQCEKCTGSYQIAKYVPTSECGNNMGYCCVLRTDIGEPTGTDEEFDYFDEYLLRAGDDSSQVQEQFSTVGDFVNIIIRNIFIVAGLLFFALILFSGFKLAIKNDKQQALQEVKQYLTTGVIGLLVMFAAYWIVQLIELLTKTTIL